MCLCLSVLICSLPCVSGLSSSSSLLLMADTEDFRFSFSSCLNFATFIQSKRPQLLCIRTESSFNGENPNSNKLKEANLNSQRKTLNSKNQYINEMEQLLIQRTSRPTSLKLSKP